MDPRLFPEHWFGLNLGGKYMIQIRYHMNTLLITCAEVVLVRNTAGHPQSNLNEIIIIDNFLGLADIMIVHHTG